MAASPHDTERALETVQGCEHDREGRFCFGGDGGGVSAEGRGSDGACENTGTPAACSSPVNVPHLSAEGTAPQAVYVMAPTTGDGPCQAACAAAADASANGTPALQETLFVDLGVYTRNR